MGTAESLSHTRWECKYDLVWIPKCRRKILYGQLREHLGEVLHGLACQKESKEDRVDLPSPRNRKKAKLQDGRKLRRYRLWWKIERTFAWLGNFRRLVARWGHPITVYRALFHLACLIIALSSYEIRSRWSLQVSNGIE